MGRAGIRAAYGTGRGKITVRARAEIVENEKPGVFPSSSRSFPIRSTRRG